MKRIAFGGDTIDLEFCHNNSEYNLSGHRYRIECELSRNSGEYNYFKEAFEFTYWFNRYVSLCNNTYYGIYYNEINDPPFTANPLIPSSMKYEYLDISHINDPEDPNSLFSQHKKQVIKNKIEEVLNSSISAYSAKTEIDYKMPKFSEEEWDKIYNNVSVIALVQGMNLGFKEYNSYCILNSTNNEEYVNPNLMYFIDNKGYYHDIRCAECKNVSTLIGYKIADFEPIKSEEIDPSTGHTKYKYNDNVKDAYACYKCINGALNNYKKFNKSSLSKRDATKIYDYIWFADDNVENDMKDVRRAYVKALARERYNTKKLLDEAYNSK